MFGEAEKERRRPAVRREADTDEAMRSRRSGGEVVGDEDFFFPLFLKFSGFCLYWKFGGQRKVRDARGKRRARK